jgi:hypothetical protein
MNALRNSSVRQGKPLHLSRQLEATPWSSLYSFGRLQEIGCSEVSALYVKKRRSTVEIKLSFSQKVAVMAYIAVCPPIRFINIGSSVGSTPNDSNIANDVLMIRAFMIYLQNCRKDINFTNTRLMTLAGGMDASLSSMIKDYKAFKTKQPLLNVAPEERLNDRIIPQDLLTGVELSGALASPVRNTIMYLNFDVMPLAGYGDNIIDVMCNLFPIRQMLTAWPVRPETDWQDLARNKIPWRLWLRVQQEAAMIDYQSLRGMDPSQPDPSHPNSSKFDFSKYDEYKRRLALLAPYMSDIKTFRENHTQVDVSVTPSPSISGLPVTVSVSVKSIGGAIPQGNVKIMFLSKQILKIYYYNQVNDVPEKFIRVAPLVNGSASVTYPEVLYGSYLVRAIYPGSGDMVDSENRIAHEVKF